MGKQKSRENNCAIIIARTSTYGQNIEPQLDELIEYAKNMGYNNLHLIETKESGLMSIEDKIGTNELVQYISENPEYNTVFCTELSRLGRRQSVLMVLKEYFIKNSIQFFIKDRNWSLFDSNMLVTEDADFLFSVYGYFSESEIRNKKERFRRAKAFYAKQGFAVSGKRLFGYKRVPVDAKRKKYEIDETEANVIITIFNWYLNGISNEIKNPSIKKITMECIKNSFPSYTHSKRNVNKLLKEEAYTGFKITNNKRKLPEYLHTDENGGYTTSSMEIKYPIIVESDIFNKVQNKLKSKNLQADKSNKNTTILSKLIECNVCGNKYEAQYRIRLNVNKSFYRCSRAKYINPCSNIQTISMQLIENTIWSLLKLDKPYLIDNFIKIKPELEIDKLNQSKSALEKKIMEWRKQAQIELGKSQIISKNKYLTSAEILNSIERSLDNIVKNIESAEKNIIEIKKNINLVQTDLTTNIENYFNKTTYEIENDKGILKGFVSEFIESIIVLYSDKKYTLLKLNFNNWTNKLKQKDITDKKDLELISKETYLIINKINTNNIKIIKTVSKVKLNAGDSLIIQIKDEQFKAEDLFELVNDSRIGYIIKNKPNDFNLRQFDLVHKNFFQIEYYKLPFYIQNH